MSRQDQLKIAITGEYNAIRKYKAYRQKAMEEGYANLAYLYQALIAGESIHLKNHRKALNEEFEPENKDFKVGNSVENLKDAIASELWENREMYPDLIKKTKKQKKKDTSFEDQVAILSFTWAKDVEKTHATVLAKALELLEQGKDFLAENLSVCIVCGNLFVGDELDRFCPVCKHDRHFIKEVKRE